MRFGRKKSAGSKKSKRKAKSVLVFVIFILASFTFFLMSLDKRMLPQAVKAVEMTAKSRINEAVNNSVMATIGKYGLTSEDFYSFTQNEQGKLNTLSVNTVLINSLCNEIAFDTSKELMNMNKEQVKIPYGALSGIKALANFGPEYTVYLMPMGEAVADYSTSFEAVGINQVNFQVWLNVNSKINIINPLTDAEISVDRKISLVNTVINAEVPQVYLNSSDTIKN